MTVAGYPWTAWLTVTESKRQSGTRKIGGRDKDAIGNVRGGDGSPLQGFLYARPEVSGGRNASGARLTISQPNFFGDLDLLEVPARVPVLLPCDVELHAPESWPLAVSEIRVCVSVSEGSFQSPTLARRWAVVPATGSTVAIPSWARKVSPLYAALTTSLQTFDAAGNALGQAVAGQQTVELAPNAVLLGQTGASAFPVVFEF